MKKYIRQTKTILGDLVTPVSLFLKFRNIYSEILLLESSDYSSKEDSHSFLCFDSLSKISLENDVLRTGESTKESFDLIKELELFIESIQIENDSMPSLGLFGYTSYDVIPHFESIQTKVDTDEKIAVMRYDLFRFMICFDHFHGKITIVETRELSEDSQMDKILALINRQDNQTFNFVKSGPLESSVDREEYIDLVKKAKAHCKRGDVFQLVLSRSCTQGFKGDDFNVYRSLRSINPSPYLYYFDYGSYRIFGSSPEAQIKVEAGIAEIHPIAGTFKRTGDDAEDLASAELLLKDEKENAEHIMLVDLARNDLSKNTVNVEVKSFREVQFFSHVIHLVSKVTGKLKEGVSGFQVFADTFPAGTLSGAPKYKAMELIRDYEKHNRSFYGGAIGVLGFNGDINQAIIIRSFLSMNGKLHFQSGAGLVMESNEEKEFEELEHKLQALTIALVEAEKI